MKVLAGFFVVHLLLQVSELSNVDYVLRFDKQYLCKKEEFGHLSKTLFDVLFFL